MTSFASFFLSSYQPAVTKRLKTWQASRFSSRLWQKDPTLWSSKPVGEITNRLGWLTLPETMQSVVPDAVAFASEIKREGMRHVVLLGMGGSSLACDVFRRVFGSAAGYPELIVLDSTHPLAVAAVEKRIDLERALFIVSSKSGTTIEPLSQFYYFWSRVGERAKNPGNHFIAITDPGSFLAKLAGDGPAVESFSDARQSSGGGRKFRRVFLAAPDVGGRFSALTAFGLVPAALTGVDIGRLLERALAMARSCGSDVAAAENPGLALGAALGELALAGRDKLTFINEASLSAFPDWAEQLIAESTGKNGKGIIPVVEESLGALDAYGKDRVFVFLRYAGKKDPRHQEQILKLQAAGHPAIRLELADAYDIGSEFFRWEFATAAAGTVLGIHPFDQPDVESAKEFARKAMKESPASGQAASAANASQWEGSFKDLLATIRPGDYVSLQAYLAPDPKTTELLQRIRLALRDRLHVATTLGYGPRFLHSTGQLHKGGPNNGIFIQLVDEPPEDISVPETDYSFGRLIRAQAQGDFQALKQRGRRLLQIHLGANPLQGLNRLIAPTS